MMKMFQGLDIIALSRCRSPAVRRVYLQDGLGWTDDTGEFLQRPEISKAGWV